MECNYIRVESNCNFNGETDFSILDTEQIKDKLIIPDTFNGKELNNLVDIPASLGDRVKELVLPNKLVYIYNLSLSKLPYLEKITFRNDLDYIVRNLLNLKEVIVDNEFRSKVMKLSFVNLPKLEKVDIRFKANGYREHTVQNCPSLLAQSFIHNKLYKIDELAFDRVKDTRILLPKNVREIATNSFINKDNEEIEIVSCNRDLYIQKDNISNQDGNISLSGVLAIEHIKDRHKVKELSIRKELEQKILKLRLLGYEVRKYSIARTLNEIDATLKIIDDNSIRESINNNIETSIMSISVSEYLMSNGYNSIAYKLKGIAKERFLSRAKKIRVERFERTTCIIGKHLTVYWVTKENIVNNLDKYINEYGTIDIKPIYEMKLEDKRIESIEEIDNKLVVQYVTNSTKQIIEI